jgi:hypothetical protein
MKKLIKENKMTIVTNKDYAKNVKVFQVACELAGVEPTPRQAAKFQAGKGAAFMLKDVAKNKAYKK